MPFLLLFPFGVAYTPTTFSLPGVPKIKIIIILIKKHEQKLFLNAIKKTKSFLGKYFRFHLSGKTTGFCLELYINSSHTEKVLMVTNILISNDNVTAKSSLKVMRILEQCDYRPKMQ